MSLLHRHSVLVVFPFVQALFVRDSQLSACGVQVGTDRYMSGVVRCIVHTRSELE
jgi:hypothetical protein